MPIDRSKIEGFDQLDPELVNLDVDPDNQYSVPFLWGTTGIAVDTADVEGEVTAWADLWDERFEGRVMLTNDMREVFQDRKSTRLNSSHVRISYAVFCLKKK